MGARIALGQVRPKKKKASEVPSRRASEDGGDRRSFFSDVEPNEEDAPQIRHSTNGYHYLNRGHGHTKRAAKGMTENLTMVLPGVPEEAAVSSHLDPGDYLVDWR